MLPLTRPDCWFGRYKRRNVESGIIIGKVHICLSVRAVPLTYVASMHTWLSAFVDTRYLNEWFGTPDIGTVVYDLDVSAVDIELSVNFVWKDVFETEKIFPRWS